MRLSNITIFTFICAILITFYSCKRDKQNDFPYVPVSFTINIITDPEFLSLHAQGNSQIITSVALGYSSLGYGDNGIIVYNAGGGDYYAYDATCPYDLPDIVAVELTGTSGVVECPNCKTNYVLPGYGMPTVDGPAVYPLHEYNTYYNPNTGELNVWN